MTIPIQNEEEEELSNLSNGSSTPIDDLLNRRNGRNRLPRKDTFCIRLK